MKNKACLLSFISLLSLVAFAGNENAAVRTIVYHGQLVNSLTGEPTTFAAGTTKNLTFSGYASDVGGTPVWQTTVSNVPVNPDGSFVTSFGDENLAGHIATGAVTHIGMKLAGVAGGDVGSPRALRPVVAVNRALVAEGLAADAKIGTFVTSGATANDLDVAGAEIAGPVIVKNRGGAVSVRPFTAEAGVTTIERGKGVKVWGTPTNLVAQANVKGGDEFAKKAPCDGVALIHSADGGAERAIRIPGTVQFCRAGDPILAPTAETGTVAVTFWPYAK